MWLNKLKLQRQPQCYDNGNTLALTLCNVILTIIDSYKILRQQL